MNLSPASERILLGALINFGLIAIGITIYIPLLFMGIMGTDSCFAASSGSLDGLGMYLMIFVPALMLAGSIVPGLLIALGKHWKWALICSALCAVINVCSYLGYYGMLGSVCG